MIHLGKCRPVTTNLSCSLVPAGRDKSVTQSLFPLLEVKKITFGRRKEMCKLLITKNVQFYLIFIS
jgi:hypothetical protein